MVTIAEENIETWENTTNGRVVLQKFSATGQKRHEIVGSHRRFHITDVERRLNQELAATEKLDVFANGTLQPVSGVDDELMDQLRLNPNIIGADDDLKAIFKLRPAHFAKRVQEIENPAALERLLDAASTEEIDATVSQVEKLTSRLQEVSPAVVEVAVSHGGSRDPSAALKPVTPR